MEFPALRLVGNSTKEIYDSYVNSKKKEKESDKNIYSVSKTQGYTNCWYGYSIRCMFNRDADIGNAEFYYLICHLGKANGMGMQICVKYNPKEDVVWYAVGSGMSSKISYVQSSVVKMEEASTKGVFTFRVWSAAVTSYCYNYINGKLGFTWSSTSYNNEKLLVQRGIISTA